MKVLAEKSGKPTTSIFERIKELEDEGSLEENSARPNVKKVGFKQTIFIAISLQYTILSYLEKFVKETDILPR